VTVHSTAVQNNCVLMNLIVI